MRPRYSTLKLLDHALRDTPWPRVWRKPNPKPSYEVLLIRSASTYSSNAK